MFVCFFFFYSLQDLNIWLKDKAYFVANRLTIADVIMFHNLYPVFVRKFLSLSKKVHNSNMLMNRRFV